MALQPLTLPTTTATVRAAWGSHVIATTSEERLLKHICHELNNALLPRHHSFIPLCIRIRKNDLHIERHIEGGNIVAVATWRHLTLRCSTEAWTTYEYGILATRSVFPLPALQWFVTALYTYTLPGAR